MLPQQPKEQQLEQVAALKKWMKGLPLSRRPLVKLTARVAPEPAVKMLQAALPPRGREQAAVELENVAATLLLPPTGALARALGCHRMEQGWVGGRSTGMVQQSHWHAVPVAFAGGWPGRN